MNADGKLVLAGIRAAIIDLDGTMVDTALDFHAALNSMRADFSLAPVDLATVRLYVGRGFRFLVRGTLAADWPTEEMERHLPQADAAFLKHYADVNGDRSRLYPEVISGLIALSDKGLKLACVTNKQSEFALPLMQRMGLAPYFNLVYPGDALPKMKPDPLPLQTAMQFFDIQPHEAVMIGDSTNDSKAARAAGCPILSVPYGYNHGRPVHEIDSDGIVENLLEAAKLIS
ncbi:MAG: phosphoglycolate phosphatase [Burkholderiaceae bacterium]|nr:phosphoglycolate phosphatase [Burkholderiaceae bacterium]